jgi:hypothetical protein
LLNPGQDPFPFRDERGQDALTPKTAISFEQEAIRLQSRSSELEVGSSGERPPTGPTPETLSSPQCFSASVLRSFGLSVPTDGPTSPTSLTDRPHRLTDAPTYRLHRLHRLTVFTDAPTPPTSPPPSATHPSPIPTPGQHPAPPRAQVPTNAGPNSVAPGARPQIDSHSSTPPGRTLA